MISFVFDTNVLFTKNHHDFTQLYLLKALDKYVEEIEKSDLCEKIKILIPQIVFEELSMHQLEQHKNVVDRLKLVSLPNWTFGYEDCFKHEFEEMKKSFQRGECEVSVPIILLPNPPDSCFSTLIEMAIRGDAPFEAEKSKDKGFKDAIIWESIKNYKEDSPDERLVFCCKDNRCTDTSLLNRYEKAFGEKIEIIRNYQEFSELLAREFPVSVVDAISERLFLLMDSDAFARQIESLYGFDAGSYASERLIGIVDFEHFDNNTKTRYSIEVEARVTQNFHDEKEKQEVDIIYDMETDAFVLEWCNFATLGATKVDLMLSEDKAYD